MARLIGITYAGVTVGKDQASASYFLTDRYTFANSYPEASVTFDVVVSNATRATFLTDEAALVAAFRKPDQALTVILGATNRHSFDPASNTGFNSRATCAKLGSESDTANSARYRCSVTVQLPANLSGRSGRQDSTISMDSTPAGKRTLVVEGSYTALSSNSATAQYAAAGEAYADAIAAGFGTFNLVNPDGFAYDDQNKVLRFRRVYEEVFYREALSGADVAALKRPVLTIDRSTPQNPSHSVHNTRPLERLRVSYQTFVDKDVTTNLPNTYAGTVLPLLIAEVAEIGGGTCVVTQATPSYNRSENSITVSLEASVDVGTGFYVCRIEDQDIIRHGITLAPVWGGTPFGRDLYETPAAHRKIVQRFVVCRADFDLAERFAIPDLPGFIEIEQYRTSTPEHVGVTEDGFDVVQITHTFVFDRADLESGQRPQNQPPGRIPTFAGSRR